MCHVMVAGPDHSLAGIHGPNISEWVIMMALAHSHSMRLMFQWQREHNWGRHSELAAPRDMVAQRLGVLGSVSSSHLFDWSYRQRLMIPPGMGLSDVKVGNTDKLDGTCLLIMTVARVGKAMGMDVIAYTATPKDSKESKADHGFVIPGTGDPDGSIPSAWYSGLDKESLHNFLKQDIDVLLISVPLTAETRHLLGREEFDILIETRRTFVSNISRGKILRQDHLIAALKQEGGLRGAALDVTDPEPLPKDSELWDLPNVVLTPHISGLSEAYTDRSFQVLDLNLTRLERGKKLVNVVDRKRGY